MILVDCRFFCSMRRWPLLVARDLGRCLVMRDAVSPGQELKWPRRMARRKVEGRGLKAHACRNAASACLVTPFWMAPLAEWRGVGSVWCSVGGKGAFGARGTVHRPLVSFRSPVMMTWPFLKIFTLYFVKRATQSSSHSWPMEMRLPDLRLSKMWPILACGESVGARGMVARLVVSMFSPLATWTTGPVLVGWTSMQWGSVFFPSS